MGVIFALRGMGDTSLPTAEKTHNRKRNNAEGLLSFFFGGVFLLGVCNSRERGGIEE